MQSQYFYGCVAIKSYVGNSASDIYGYDNTAYPQITTSQVLTVTYYDNYDHHSDMGWGYAYTGTFSEPVITSATGLVTGSYTRLLNSSKMLRKAIRYDDRLREKLVITENAMDGWDRTHITYRNEVSPLVTSTYSINRIHSGYNYLYEYFTYDHRDRLLKVEHQIGTNSANKKTLSNNSYNAIGQLIEKKLHDDGSPAQTVGYSYNERGWLKHINGGHNFDDGDDKFGMTLKYADAYTGYERYNGNIGEMRWKSVGGTSVPQDQQSYHFTYDGLNRLKKANYSGTAGNFNAKIPEYDKNGNILQLKRLGVHNAGVDNLFYEYSGNQLTRVEDTDDKNLGFIDVTSSVGTEEYQYDYNGNMVKDLNKGVTDIDYNYLNLPELVTMDNGDKINYTYDATGVKHYKIVDDGAPDTTQYVGPYHFTNSSLKFIQHSEGRALKTGGGYQYEYNLTDHLGNVRVSVDEGGNVLQRDDYYPFGLTFNHSNVSPENDYKYNGFEEQKETGWYDYQARFYDPALGRFLNVDPAADLMRRHSTYSYAFNNPIRYIDPDGMMPEDESEQFTLAGAASALTDDETFQTDGYSELSASQRSEVGDAGRYTGSSGETVPGLGNKHTVKNPKNWLQRAWNVIRGAGYLNKAYAAKQKYDDIHIEYVEGGAIAFQIATIEINDAEGNLVTVVTANPIKAWGAGVDWLEPSEMDLMPTPPVLGMTHSILMKAATVPSKGGLNAVGRALQKHGSRAGSIFPKATGNVASINGQGLSVLQEILTDPSVTKVTRHHARFGEILEYKIPGGRGARFSANGNKFIGFIE